MARIIDNLLLVFFFMLLFSNFISAMTTYFRSQDLELYFSLPVKPEKIFQVKYFETATYASWASLVIVIPLIYSYGLIQNSAIFNFPIALLAILFFAQIAAALGNITTFLFLRFFPKISRRFSIAALSLGGILATLYFLLGKPTIFRVFEVQTEAELAKFIENLGQVGSIYLPSNWLSLFAREIFTGEFNIIYLSLLLAAAIASYLLLSEIGSQFYRKLWFQQRDLMGGSKRLFSRFFKTKYKRQFAVLIKDVVLFFRNTTQWVQLLIFLILVIIYIVSIYRTTFFFTAPFWRALIGFANFSYVSFLFATLGVRFIYPSISQEGRCFLLLKSSPIKLRTILFSKFILYSIIAVIAGELLILITNAFLAADTVILKVAMIVIAVVITTIVAINLGIGTIFPDFNEKNPAKLAAGGGGVIAAIICLAYSGFVVALFAHPTLSYLRFRGSTFSLAGFLINFSVFFLLSLATIIFFLGTGIRHLERIE